MNGLNFAIIEQAIDDYKNIVMGKEEITHDCNLYEIEQFLQSGWCDSLLHDSMLSCKDLLDYVHKFKREWEEQNGTPEPDMDAIKRRALSNKCIAIMCVETGKIYFGTRAAAGAMHTKPGQVARSLKNENITAGGYHFRTVYNPYNDGIWGRRQSQNKPNEHTGERGSYKKVRCIDTGKVYINTKQASKELGIPARKISRCARGSTKHAGGMRWEYTDDDVIP